MSGRGRRMIYNVNLETFIKHQKPEYRGKISSDIPQFRWTKRQVYVINGGYRKLLGKTLQRLSLEQIIYNQLLIVSLIIFDRAYALK